MSEKPLQTASFPTPALLPMTGMHVRAASVPPAMSRNSVTGAAPVTAVSRRKEHCNAYEGAYNY